MHFWHRARLGLINYLLSKAPTTTNIAAIGCGTGEELSVLAKHGQVVGYDINRDALALAAKQGLTTAHLNLETEDLPQSFDVITAFDVLEHLADDNAVFKRLNRGLKPNGYLLLTVPAYQWLFSSHDLALEHKRRYGKKELLQKLSKANFCVVEIAYWNCCLAPAIIGVRLLKKILPLKIHVSEAKTPPPILNWLGWQILSLENSLILLGCKLPWGISLYAVAKKI